MGGSAPGVGGDFHGSRVGRGAAQKSQHEMGKAEVAEDWVKWSPVREAGKLQGAVSPAPLQRAPSCH